MRDILLIEDDPGVRDLIGNALVGAGYTVRTATNGIEGVALCRQSPPALVITDILMPVMDGIETILTLRREFPQLPIVAISGGDRQVYLSAAAKFGAFAILAKPFGLADLLRTVERALGAP